MVISTGEQALVWADVTEFTLAMEASESTMAKRMLSWVDRCVQGWLPNSGGRFLQQAGDAVLLAFADTESAWQAAEHLRRDWQALTRLDGASWGRDLRVALHWGRVWQGPQGYVAHSLNQLARLSQEVVAGRVWMSEAFWVRLSDTRQRSCEDLGWMHFRHLDSPIRVFQVCGPESHTARSGDASPDLSGPRPRLVVQSAARTGAFEWTQAMTEALRLDPELEVSALAPGAQELAQAISTLRMAHADYLLWFQPAQGGRARVVLLAAPLGFEVANWVVAAEGAQEIDPGLGRATRQAWRRHASACAQSQPARSLSHGVLRHAALSLMHAGQLRDFDRAHELLEVWHERFKRSAEPLIWKALWQVMRHTRGLPGASIQAARKHASEALRLEPEHPHAWAAKGFVLGHLEGDAQGGLRDLEQAQALKPGFVWSGVYGSVLWCMAGDARRGLNEAGLALSHLSTDGLADYALGLAGHAAVFAGQLPQGLRWLEASWRAQRYHSPTVRMLVVAHQMLGHLATARLFLRELHLLEPQLTARSYLARNRAGHARRAEMAHWMIQAGLPRK
ncbi:MAG: hypothetical protein QM527_14960 [Alphaproteobacteria bacterium]|nr:hypothetical protein [Alphaproteobacteria bacterium]